MAAKKPSIKSIEDRYALEDRAINQERNDFLLPQVIDFIREKKWINLQPEYQRRQVWDKKKRSIFLESLLMNLPVPPVFLFEPEFSRYEVMDGQQRLSSIANFYSNKYKLTGLERWSDLNGLTYEELPPLLQRGLDRRRISAVILQSTSSDAEDDSIRRMVFERLNTGGQKLNAQELRNCIYSSDFALLLVELAGNKLFNDMWDVPRYEDNIRGNQITSALSENVTYKRMADCEIVLRFFAFRDRRSIKGSVKSILDNCMKSNLRASADELNSMASDFNSRIALIHSMFGINAFRIKGDGGSTLKLSVPFYDGLIYACDKLFDQRVKLKANSKKIRERLNKAFASRESYELITAKANTADSIKKRLTFVEDIFSRAI